MDNPFTRGDDVQLSVGGVANAGLDPSGRAGPVGSGAPPGPGPALVVQVRLVLCGGGPELPTNELMSHPLTEWLEFWLISRSLE